LLIHLSQ